MNVKRMLMKVIEPIILPLTRFVLKRHYRSTKNLSEIGNYKRILIMAPHVDDETIGAGATIRQHVENGAVVSVISITDGAKSSSNMSKEQLSSIRKKEMEEVKNILGITNVYYMNLPDGDVKSNQYSQEALMGIIKDFQPDLIYCTPYVDAHVDHVNTGHLLSDSLKRLDYDCMIRLYEINCPVPPKDINCIIDISDTFQLKKRAISVFNSQAIAFDGFLELSLLKAELLNDNSSTKAVETFLEISSFAYIDQFDRLLQENYNYTKLFKQANRSITLLWAVYQNLKIKQEIYQKRV